MTLARRAQPIVAGGRAKRRPRCSAIHELFAGNRQTKLPCGTRGLWDALSARKINSRRPEPGAALRSAPVYDGAGPSDRMNNGQTPEPVGLPRKLSSFKNELVTTPARRLLPITPHSALERFPF